MSTLKKIVVYIKFIVTLVLIRTYGNIIYDLAQNYEGKVSLSDFRTFEKLSTKKRKADLDVGFLKDCQAFGVFPKFICFPLPNVGNDDTYAIRKRLLRSAIIKRSREQRKITNDLSKKTSELHDILNPLDWLILNKALKKNIDKRINTFLMSQRKKLKNLTRNKALPFTHKDTVTNLSSHHFKVEELDLLKNGLSFSIKPPRLNKSDILTTFEHIHHALKNRLKKEDDYTHLKTELAHIAQSYISSYRPTAADLKKYHILKNIRNNDTIIILKPDKGNGVIIMDRQVYKNSCFKIINNPTKFKLLSKDPTLFREGKLQRFLRKLKNQGSLDDNTYSNILPKGSQPARFYGLPKLHKKREPNEAPPIRPIISSINAYNYKLAKYLCTLLNPIIPDDFTTTDSFSFVEEFTNFDTNNKFFISFDVESLFTNIPLNETLDIAINLIYTNNPNFPINKKDLKQLFDIATSQSHFLFDNAFYDQVDGVAMGSPLAPVLANLFMGYHERTWINNYSGPEVLFYRRYVDDTFCVFHNENDALLFFDYLNAQHPNIKFTFEKEENGKIPFLDVLITKSADNCTTSIFHKKTYTGLLTNFLSFSPLTYKTNLIKTLIDRTRKINNTENGFQNDLRTLIFTLKRNCFPFHIIDKVIKYYNEKSNTNTVDTHLSASEPKSEKQKINYYKLPYIGVYSQLTEKRLKCLIKRLCTDFEIKLVFSSFKIKNLFSFKDPIPSDLKSLVVYQFTCAGCNSRYIGETSRHLATRIKEHTSTDKNSHILKHLQKSSNCQTQYSPSCFKIIDSANCSFSLKLKEALHITKIKPELNKQIYHLNTIFSL